MENCLKNFGKNTARHGHKWYTISAWNEIEIVKTTFITPRKICKTCKCGAADHDIKSDEDFTHQLILKDIRELVMGPDGVSMVKENIRKFRLASSGSDSDVVPKGNFLWVPSGVTKEVVGGVWISVSVEEHFIELTKCKGTVDCKMLCTYGTFREYSRLSFTVINSLRLWWWSKMLFWPMLDDFIHQK